MVLLLKWLWVARVFDSSYSAWHLEIRWVSEASKNYKGSWLLPERVVFIVRDLLVPSSYLHRLLSIQAKVV